MKGTKGFTLIEIVMTLVLIGVIASIVVPKYIDLEYSGRVAAADDAAAEAQSRLNARFSELVLGGASCWQAKLLSMKEVFPGDDDKKAFGGWSFNISSANDDAIILGSAEFEDWGDGVKVTPRRNKLYLPQCNGS